MGSSTKRAKCQSCICDDCISQVIPQQHYPSKPPYDCQQNHIRVCEVLRVQNMMYEPYECNDMCLEIWMHLVTEGAVLLAT